MSISKSDYRDMLLRLDKNKMREQQPHGDGPKRESALHDSIIAYCNSQWPKWKYVHSRMDKKSTIQKGCQDFTIFLPGGRLLCVECKRAKEKPTQEQLAWAKEMEMLNHKIFFVTSMTEFLECVGKNKAAA